MTPIMNHIIRNPQGIVRRGLKAEYRFDEGQGDILHDYSGNGNHGQLGSAAGADTNDPTWTGQGLSFGGDDSVNCGNLKSDVLSLQMVEYFPVSISSSSSATYPIWLKENNKDFIGYGTVTAGLTNEIISIAHSNGARAGWCDATAQILQGWHFIEYIWDGTKYRIIIDMIEKPITLKDTPQVLNANRVLLGNPAFSYAGAFGYFVFYENILKSSERIQNHHAIKRIMAGRGVQI